LEVFGRGERRFLEVGVGEKSFGDGERSREEVEMVRRFEKMLEKVRRRVWRMLEIVRGIGRRL
jgi:hypothetical protein